VRILYICHRIPYPPDKGEKIRAFHQLRAMAGRHEVDLFTLADDPADMERGPAALRDLCRRVTVVGLNPRLARLRSLPYLFTSAPLTIPYFGSEELRRQIDAAVRHNSYDRVFVYCSAMAQYLTPAGIPVVIDLVDVDSNKWAQYATFSRLPMAAVYRREAGALRRYERRVCENSAAVVVTTEREARLLTEIAPSARVHVIPNGVDTDYFQPPPNRPDAAPPVIGFMGDMGYFPNQDAVTYFARKVLPLIRRSAPDARFLIVGRNPSREVRDLAAIDGVEVTGFVPDVRPHLARMRVSVAPFSIAAGIQNKILEAMSCEIPVVATPRAAQGLTPATAAIADIADGPEEIASRTALLLLDPGFAREKGRESRRRVAVDYNWERALERLLEIVEQPSRMQSVAAGSSPVRP
jgi:sugar transferase (PEP-CTERM/EpsH1 system associated)